MLFDETKDKKIKELEAENKKLKERLMWYSDVIERLQIELNFASAENYELKKNVEKLKKKDLTISAKLVYDFVSMEE